MPVNDYNPHVISSDVFGEEGTGIQGIQGRRAASKHIRNENENKTRFVSELSNQLAAELGTQGNGFHGETCGQPQLGAGIGMEERKNGMRACLPTLRWVEGKAPASQV